MVASGLGRAMPSNLHVGVGWSTYFDQPGLKGLRIRPLRYSYRAPAFLAQALVTDGSS
jgi:hypothetical protein